ncbi:hypothetical protein ABZW18_25210 [Streptomyces sp. NPDC004647]|uniref:hypothetical protein n=1 Tax=Streptomyces sp. NPDC004647 TaxID=3154671 RepID=UPI0033B04B8D
MSSPTGGRWEPWLLTAAAPAAVLAVLRLDLYADAKAEGGELVVYAERGWKNQQDDTERAFERRLPGIGVEMVVDYSTYQDARRKGIGLGGRVTPGAADSGSRTVRMIPDTGDPFVAWASARRSSRTPSTRSPPRSS